MTNALIQAVENLFKKPSTRLYPIEPSPVSTDYRGLIKYNKEKCIFCIKCEDVCPPGAILFDQSVDSNHRIYHYNPYLCIYCGECVRACPEPGKEGALWQEEELIEPTTDSNVNDDWFKLEQQIEENKAAYTEFKKAEKLRKQQEKAAAEAATQNSDSQNDTDQH